jgi:hypothetical protein
MAAKIAQPAPKPVPATPPPKPAADIQRFGNR